MDITRLPLDVRVYLVSYITTRRDLISVRKTCKALYDAVIPRLYRRMALHESLAPYRLTAAFSPDNAGLQHVRHLEVVANCGDYHSRRMNVDQIITLLANLLPRDVLLTFTFNCTSTVEVLSLHTLYKRQRHLRTARIDTLAAASWVYKRVLSARNITLLNMIVANHSAAQQCGYLVKDMQSLMHIELRADLERYCKASAWKYSSDRGRANASEQIIVNVFDHHLRNNLRPLSLRTLQLYDVCLDRAAEKIVQAVDCSRLDTLGLQNCTGALALLRRIKPTGIPARLNLKTLMVTGPRDRSEERTDDAIDDFIGSFIGLEQLIIHAPAQETLRPSTTSLQAHAQTLQLLYLDCKWDSWPEDDPPETRCYPADDLRELLEQCSALKELAVQVPYLDLEYDEETIDDECGYFMDALSVAPRLQSLRILTLPNRDDYHWDIHDDPAHQTWAQTSMLCQANAYIRGVAGIRALSFLQGPHGTATIGELQVNAGFFGKGAVINAYGRSEATALDMRKEVLQDIVPESEIFDVEVEGWRLMRYGYEP